MLLENIKIGFRYARDIDDLLEILEYYYRKNKDMFPLDITSTKRLDQFYHCFQTFRKTSASRDTNKAVPLTNVDIVNRWEIVEPARGSIHNCPMQQHYVQLELLLGPFLRYI